MPGMIIGGGGGIRTRDAVAGIPVFKTGAFNRSATPPRLFSSLVFPDRSRCTASNSRSGMIAIRKRVLSPPFS